MRPELHRYGASRSPVAVIDGFSGAVAETIELAAALAPFSRRHGTFYPGVRRPIAEADGAAYAYVVRTLEAAAPFIAGAFDADSFDLIEGSFSMVTVEPGDLSPPQRAPHFDSTDPGYVAVLHYLGGIAGSGTAFFRQRSTGIETVDETNVGRFVAAAQRESGALSGYIQGSNESFEQIGAIEAVPDRLVLYQGCLLHSGIIPPQMRFSANPRVGRLTANLFVKVHRT